MGRTIREYVVKDELYRLGWRAEPTYTMCVQGMNVSIVDDENDFRRRSFIAAPGYGELPKSSFGPTPTETWALESFFFFFCADSYVCIASQMHFLNGCETKTSGACLIYLLDSRFSQDLFGGFPPRQKHAAVAACK